MNNNLKVCMLGSGNVATHMAHALNQAGHSVIGIYSRNLTHATQLAESVDTATATDNPASLPEADIYIFAVKDDAIAELARHIASCGFSQNALYIHTSGSTPLSVISPFFTQTAVLYPMQTFSKTQNVCFQQVPLFVEGSTPESLQRVEAIARQLSANVTRLDSKQRRILHLSAVFACNFTNHCYALAFRLLRESHIDPQCLLPLIDETARKVHQLDPLAAQTGPAVRWDERIINKHLDQLTPYPEIKALYQLMSQSIHHTHD